MILRLGNESNPVDGTFGPFTYGLRGIHRFSNQMSLEAGYIRLHEPLTSLNESVLDEAQVSLRLREIQVMNQPIIIGTTAWKNRMIDMYTNVGGIEFTRTGELSVTLGAYYGTATREYISGHFVGGQVGLASSVGPVEFGIAYMGGKIDDGTYRKLALEASTELGHSSQLPLGLTFGIEERYFNFGGGGPISEPQDEFIFIAGIEIHLENLF